MTDEIENFNYAEIFDENTVKIFDKYVNVEKILENKRENQLQKELRMAEKAKEAENGEPPVKKSKKSEKRGQNKKRKHTGLVLLMVFSFRVSRTLKKTLEKSEKSARTKKYARNL